MGDRHSVVDEAFDILGSGAVDLISEAELRSKLESGRPFRVKLGLDPSSPTSTSVMLSSCAASAISRSWVTPRC